MAARARTAIGARWAPGETIRIDTRHGRYEHVNPSRHMTRDESMLQAALAPSWAERRGEREIRARRVAHVLASLVLFAALGALLAWRG